MNGAQGALVDLVVVFAERLSAAMTDLIHHLKRRYVAGER